MTAFVQEKWKIASDRSGSGNTANIGSIKNIDALRNGRGDFADYGEEMFDKYWMNYGKLLNTDGKPIRSLEEFLEFTIREKK